MLGLAVESVASTPSELSLRWEEEWGLNPGLYIIHAWFWKLHYKNQAVKNSCKTALFTTVFVYIQGDSVARGPKLLSIKNYVIEIMTWRFIQTYRERCKIEPVHNRCWNWSPFTSKHTWMRFSKFWNTFPKVSKLKAWIFWRIASLSCSIVRGVFLYTLPFNRPQRRKSAGVRSGDLGGQRFLWDNSVFKKNFQCLACSHLKCDMLHRLVGNTQ